MRVLVGCEMSGRVRDAFRALGHDAVSCDLLPSQTPGPHIQGDLWAVLDDGWDLLVAFPPCTYLCSSGLHWNTRRPERAALTEEALAFVHRILDANVPRIALENPIGCISSRIRRPDQIIQPYQFGEDASKATCLWLKNLPPLRPTQLVPPEYGCRCGHRFEMGLGKYGCPNCGGASGPAKKVWGNQTASGQNRLPPSEERALIRGLTFPGIAAAMADQWSDLR
jgi:hypothetical protein